MALEVARSIRVWDPTNKPRALARGLFFGASHQVPPEESTMPASPADIAQQTAKRRTFAIISHPDAGKTTLTEKLLLYSGMLRTAGMVKKAKGGGLAASDWMAMEQERGISVTASAMQFPYKDRIINVLDTPGHEDFADDTFRTLTAADCAIMVLDAAKGVEKQTRRLFEACRLRARQC